MILHMKENLIYQKPKQNEDEQQQECLSGELQTSRIIGALG